MVFPYIHREQILLWSKQKIQFQNKNPFFFKNYIEDLALQKKEGIFFKIIKHVDSLLEKGTLNKSQFFDLA